MVGIAAEGPQQFRVPIDLDQRQSFNQGQQLPTRKQSDSSPGCLGGVLHGGHVWYLVIGQAPAMQRPPLHVHQDGLGGMA